MQLVGTPDAPQPIHGVSAKGIIEDSQISRLYLNQDQVYSQVVFITLQLPAHVIFGFL